MKQQSIYVWCINRTNIDTIHDYLLWIIDEFYGFP